MAKISLGDLVVRVAADADHFDKVMLGAEKRVTDFTTKLARPLTSGGLGAKSIAGMLTGSIGAFSNPLSAITTGVSSAATAVDSLIKKMPGGKMLSASLGIDSFFGGTAFDESAKRGLDYMKDLRREGQRFQISPEYMGGLKFAAGPDEEVIPKTLTKIELAMSKLREGDPEMTKHFEKFFGDAEQFKSLGLEKVIDAIADKYQTLGDRIQGVDLLAPILGPKGVSQAHFLFAGGSEKIASSIAATSKSYDPQLGPVLDERSAYNKRKKLYEQEVDARNARFESGTLGLEQSHGRKEIDFVTWLDKRVGMTLQWMGGKSTAIDKYIQKFEELEKKEQKKTKSDVAAPAFDPAETRAHDMVEALQKQDKAFTSAAMAKTLDELATRSLWQAYNQLNEAIQKTDFEKLDESLRAQQDGLDNFNLSQAEIAARRAERLGDQDKADRFRGNDLAGKAQQLADQAKSPIDVAMQRINDLYDNPFLNDTQRGFHIDGILKGAGVYDQAVRGTGAARAIERGSQDDLAANDNAQAQRIMQEMVETPKKLVEVVEQLKQERAESNKINANLAEALRGMRRPADIRVAEISQ